MASIPRTFRNGNFYHIYNRGNRKNDIFLEESDYERFLEKLLMYKEKYSVNILVYCLMPNHFHLLVQINEEKRFSKFISDLCNSQSRYFNVKYQTVGSLFQGRFKAKLVETDVYLVHLSKYIHLNPKDLFNRESFDCTNRIVNYKWSSLSGYLNNEQSSLVEIKPIMEYFQFNCQKYFDFLFDQPRRSTSEVEINFK